MLRAEGVELCTEFLHWAAKQRDPFGQSAEGTTLDAAAGTLRDLGQPPEECWPYDPGRDQISAGYAPPPKACEMARARRLDGGRALATTTTALRIALDSGEAVLLGVRLYKTWFTPTPDGRIAIPRQGDRLLGGHAVLLVGYVEGEGEGGGYFLVRNSWGADWAAGGYGFLPYAYVEAHGLQAWALGTIV